MTIFPLNLRRLPEVFTLEASLRAYRTEGHRREESPRHRTRTLRAGLRCRQAVLDTVRATVAEKASNRDGLSLHNPHCKLSARVRRG
jgi:hypothetical protein